MTSRSKRSYRYGIDYTAKLLKDRWINFVNEQIRQAVEQDKPWRFAHMNPIDEKDLAKVGSESMKRALDRENDDDHPLGFGKWRGQTPRQLMQSDPAYVLWISENVKSVRLSDELLADAQATKDEQEDEAAQEIDYRRFQG